MQQTDLHFRFKGARTYIQGPDIVDEALTALVAAGADPRDIDIAFHTMATRQLTLHSGEPPAGVTPNAICSFTSQGERRRVYLLERDEAVAGRTPYPEEDIVRTLQVDPQARRAVLAGHFPYSDMELFVSMTKALHLQVLPELKGKWLFVRGRLPRYVRQAEAAERSMTLLSSFNGKLTRSEAALDGVKVGEIFFSLS